MARKNTITMRIDQDMKNLIDEFASKNGMTRPVASKKLANILKGNFNGKKVILKEEIIF